MHLPRSATAISLVVLGAALSAQAPSPGQPRDILPFAATERTLANGLKVIVVPTGFPNLVSIQIPVQAGSRNEVEPGRTGFAHFFEHLMFRGTPDTPPERYRELMAKAGARDNASTGDDLTHYYATFAKEDLETIIGLYADMFQHLAYSEADFKTEARAVLGEYNKNSADPERRIFEAQRERYYKTHTYKHTTLGFIQDIENMPNEYEYSKLFFERWYRPQFTTIIVAGDVTADQVLPLVEKYWGGWAIGTGQRPTIPQEPAPKGPQYVHVPWPTDTLPLVTVAFPGPAFDENSKDTAAMELIAALYFGRTANLYKKLVVTEQKVDELDVDAPASFDPSLFTVTARVKRAADAVYVRDQIMATFAEVRASMPPADRLSDAQSYNRYALTRSFDSTERIASVLFRYVAYRRSYDTINQYYRTLDLVTPADLQAAARKYFTTQGLIVTTLAKDALPRAIAELPPIDRVAPAQPLTAEAKPVAPTLAALALPAAASAEVPTVIQKSVLPQLEFKLLFSVGSSHDPAGKEGLAALTASMISAAGSRRLTTDQVEKLLYPMAGSFSNQVDKEMTSFTGRIHRDQWQTFLAIILPQLLEPGFRDEDFRRLKDAQLNALTQDLRSNNEEELGKERLQGNIFRGTPYGHVALGTVAGINAVTLDDVKQFAARMYARANLRLGVNGDAPAEMITALQSAAAALPVGTAAARVKVEGTRPASTDVEIIEKDTRATAISFGFPIEVTRNHPDFAALSVARAVLGEHRMQSGRLFQRIREVRGMNYGDYAYIEAFPGGMFTFFPSPNLVRQRQIFEIWIRPVVPANAHMALRLGIYELKRLIDSGLTQAEFDRTRDYLMKNVYVMTARQDEQLGYAFDSQWYGTGEFTAFMRGALARLTLADVNAAVRKHLSADRLSVVIVTKDAARLQKALLADAFSPIVYDGEKPVALLEEDKAVGALKLNLSAANVRITPAADVFAR